MSLPLTPPSDTILGGTAATLATRKRQRTASMSSDTSTSKRGASEELVHSASARAVANGDVQSSTGPSAPSTGLEDDIDAYMNTQTEGTDPDPALIASNNAAASAPAATVSPRERLEKIKQLEISQMEAGATWYIVSKRWLDDFQTAGGEPPKRRVDATSSIAPNNDSFEADIDDRDYSGMITPPGKQTPVPVDGPLGPVDNEPLVNAAGFLREHLSESVDYEVVPEEVWQLFEQWHGPAKYPLPRKVIPSGTFTTSVRVELHPPRVTLFRLVAGEGSDLAGDDCPSFETSVTATIQHVLDACAAAVGITARGNDIRAWKFDPSTDEFNTVEHIARDYPVGRLELDSATIWPPSRVKRSDVVDVAGLGGGEALVIEAKTDGAWLAKDSAEIISPFFGTSSFFNSAVFGSKGTASSSSYNNTASSSTSVTVRGRLPAQPAIKRGTMGLVNLGNTCFMNSALQCLVHTAELTDYFLHEVYREELNTDNPLGMGGAVANAFGALIHKLWETGQSSMAPREFKTAIARFAPQFIGYQQHDSQELLAFLLDGLHEDLNRVLKKPYVENPDWDGGAEREMLALANKTWEGYMSRNDSIIVDLFQGQYKSTLICPECEKVSITFDPFMYLTLPLPVDKRWSHRMHFAPWKGGGKITAVLVNLPANSSIRELKNTIARYVSTEDHVVEGRNLHIAEIWHFKFYKHYDDGDVVNSIQRNDDMVCYELPCKVAYGRRETPPENYIVVPVTTRHARPEPAFKTTYGGHRTYGNEAFGYPFLAALTVEEAQNEHTIYNALVERYAEWIPEDKASMLYSWQPRSPTPEVEEEYDVVKKAEDDVEADADADALQDRGEPMQVEEGDDEMQVIEFRETGEVIQGDANPKTDGDEDEEQLHMTEYDEDGNIVVNGSETLPAGSTSNLSQKIKEDAAELRGPKKDLFTMVIQSSPGDLFEANTFERTVAWEDRKRIAAKAPAPAEGEVSQYVGCLKRGDSLACDWLRPMADYFFLADNGKDFMQLEVDELRHPEFDAAEADAKAKANRKLRLDDCLDEFSREEVLGEDDLWYCPRCKKHQQATKKFELWKVPDVLVIHLKRFSNSRMLRDKIDTLVDFPIESLDLELRVGERAALKAVAAADGVEQSEELSEPLVYDLFAVDEHLGGLGGGHYRAFAKNQEDKTWYHFDDSHVSPTNPERAISSTAYLLFYRRRSNRPIGGKSLEKIEAARSKAPSERSGSANSPRPQLPTPSNSPPPRYRNDNDDRMISSTQIDFRRAGPSNFDTPSTSPGTPDEDISIYRSGARFIGPVRRPASPTSSNEAEIDGDERSSPQSLPSPLGSPGPKSYDLDVSPVRIGQGNAQGLFGSDEGHDQP